MVSRTQSVRGLTEGAILAAIVALLALARQYVPLVGLAGTFLCPLPVAILVFRHGLRVAVLASFVAAAVGSMIGGVLTGLEITAAFAPLGLAIGIGAQRRWEASRVVTVAGIATTGSMYISVLASMVGLGIDPRRVFREMLETSRSSLTVTAEFYKRVGFDPDRIEQWSTLMRQALDLSVYLIPGMLIVAAVVGAFINYVVARRVLTRWGIELGALPPLGSWGVPAFLVWTLPVGYAMLLIGARWQIPGLALAGFNVYQILMLLLMLQGLLVAWIVMGRFEIPVWYRWLIFLPLLYLPYTIVSLFGLADATFNVRERWKPAREGTVRSS